MTTLPGIGTQKHRTRSLRFRGLTSFAVTLSFAVMATSGIVLYFAPRGRDANWSGWTCLGLWREQWVAIHIVITALFLVFGIVHLVLNWRPLYNYIYNRARRRVGLWRELLLAAIIVLGLATLAMRGVWPASQLVQWSDQSKDGWSRSLPRAPFPHAELMTLTELADRAAVAADRLVEALESNGLAVEGPSLSLLELAEENGTTPAAIFERLGRSIPEIDRVRLGGRGAQRRRAAGGNPGRDPL